LKVYGVYVNNPNLKRPQFREKKILEVDDIKALVPYLRLEKIEFGTVSDFTPATIQAIKDIDLSRPSEETNAKTGLDGEDGEQDPTESEAQSKMVDA